MCRGSRSCRKPRTAWATESRACWRGLRPRPGAGSPSPWRRQRPATRRPPSGCHPSHPVQGPGSEAGARLTRARGSSFLRNRKGTGRSFAPTRADAMGAAWVRSAPRLRRHTVIVAVTPPGLAALGYRRRSRRDRLGRSLALRLDTSRTLKGRAEAGARAEPKTGARSTGRAEARRERIKQKEESPVSHSGRAPAEKADTGLSDSAGTRR